MPREKEYSTPAERQAAYRARRVAETQEGEQALRDRLGYASSETRTQAERQATAERIARNADPEATAKAQAIWQAAASRGLYDFNKPKGVDTR